MGPPSYPGRETSPGETVPVIVIGHYRRRGPVRTCEGPLMSENTPRTEFVRCPSVVVQAIPEDATWQLVAAVGELCPIPRARLWDAGDARTP